MTTTEIISEHPVEYPWYPWELNAKPRKFVTAKRGDVTRSFVFMQDDVVTSKEVDEWWDYSAAMVEWKLAKPVSPDESRRRKTDEELT